MSNSLNLGITKIGDLLIHNKITITEAGTIDLDKIPLKIPPYQRPYKWTAKNAIQLLDDIEEAMTANKEVYRVGTLILHKNYNLDTQTWSYDIVDGQQRTITFSLLLKCICDESVNVNFLGERLSNNAYNVCNVENNYWALSRRMGNMADEKEKAVLRDYIENHCELIVVITENLSEAFQFFDSQNARGKALYPHDLLKAYHLREMNDLEADEMERIVEIWENLNQRELASLFSDYLYRIKEWVKGNRAYELSEHNIDLFKGVTAKDNYPYAQFYKGAFSYADDVNHSKVPFVTGIQKLNPFQINAPVVAGKAFFEYTKHYFDILADIQNNDKYEGYFIKGNEIVQTLDRREYRNGVGNRITRLMFDTAILLYVDRFCPAIPSKTDSANLEQFIVFSFIWAYSMRAQYKNVGWQVAQNYVMGTASKDGVVNGFNIYKVIAESDCPSNLISRLSDKIVPIETSKIRKVPGNVEEQDNGVFTQYLYYFFRYHFWEGNP